MGMEEQLRTELTDKNARILQLEALLAEADADRFELHDANVRLESTLRELSSSRAFRMAYKFVCILRQAAPPESRRRRLLRHGYRTIRGLPKLRDRRWVAQTSRQLASQLGEQLARWLLALQKQGVRLVGRKPSDKVIYQPHAAIVHCEGLTSGTNLESGVKSHQVVSQTNFRRRWGGGLVDHAPAPPPDSDLNVYTRKIEVASRGRILVIDHRLPTPDRDGGSVRMMEMLRALARSGHRVTFIPDNLAAMPDYLERLQSIEIEVIHRPYYVSAEEYLREHGHEFNLAIICRLPAAARHFTTVRRLAPRAKIVFDTVDLHFLRSEREVRVSHDESLEAATAGVKRQELRLARWADVTLVVSPIEKAILEAERPGIDVRIISSIIPLGDVPIPGFDGRRNIVFIGCFEHTPNADAVLYFAREIFPRIHHRLPDAVFQVIGPHAPPEVRRLASPNIEVLGYVPDVRPLFDRARLSVAPLRFGAGVKIKVSQSMAFGVPAVVTSIAAEGLHLVDGQNALFADDPERFADAVVRLWTSRELWEALSTNGLENIREHFSVQGAARSINDLLLWAGLPVPAQSHSAKPPAV
jgi:glycosyltransferase involved in cell wall biosynthesis